MGRCLIVTPHITLSHHRHVFLSVMRKKKGIGFSRCLIVTRHMTLAINVPSKLLLQQVCALGHRLATLPGFRA